MEKESKDLNILLLGNSSAVQFGEKNILLGQKQPAEDDFSKTVPELRNLSGRNVSVINALDLQEAELYLNSLDQDIVRLVSENDIHAFVFILRLRQLTDTDKVGLDWLEKTFGESALPFVMILFTYEREEDCDTIIDDLKKSPVLEHLLGKCGDRYHTCSNSMNSQSEMRTLLEKIDHMVCENKQCCYTVEMYKTASNLQEGLEDRRSAQSVYSSQLHHEEENITGSRKIKGLQWIKATVLLLLKWFALTFWKLVKHFSLWGLQWIKATVLLLLKWFALTFWKLVEHFSLWMENAEDKFFKGKTGQLFLRLNLKRNQKHPLKPADVFQITAQSLCCQEPCAEAELVQSFLQRLLLLDYRARDITAKEAVSALDHIESSTLNKEEDNTFAGFINKQQPSLHEATHTDHIHPMDVQMAVFHCSDSFLKQVIVTKLSQCQYALPLLLPNPFTGEIEFPMWTFRQVRNSWKTKDTAGKVTSKTMPVYKTQTPMVAFFRIGSISSSKSQLMNSLINVKHNTFFHRNCPGSSRERLLMDGVVEIAWYLPSGKGTDHFTDCAAFCNLRGDARTHKKQLEILTELSSVNVVVLDGKDSHTANNKTLTKLYKGSKPLVCLICEDDSCPTGMKSLKYKIGLKGRNQAAVSEELRNIIKHCFSVSHPTFKLEDVGKNRGIMTDEDNPECKKAKNAALQMINLLEGTELFRMKEKFLPCQGKLWHEWCKKNKELYQLHGTNIEMENTEIQSEMKQIRKRQQEKGLTELMELFIETMDLRSSVPMEKSYFLKWIQILLDSSTADDLSTLHHEYDEKWSTVLDLKKQHDKSEQMNNEQKQLEKISEKLKAATFGLEHILREMGQVYESFISVQRDSEEYGQDIFSCFPKLAAELLISGHPVELMDGDAAHVPLIWVSAVLDEVIEILGDQTVFVLSVLGLQSSGKSTMLNAMFGLQFAVSAGRCTRGAFMQLVKVSEEMKGELKFDYILVVDTEGLRALELTGISTRHHDNKLATFVIGLGNMTLINIFGENPAEMQDILQIVVMAFLRMKKVNLSPSCMFVHQNVSDVAANEKNMEGRRHLQEVLDKMTEVAAKEEACGVECFNDVIAFEIKNDVRYFAQLWEGCPPMAPTNPSYSENVLELKKTLLYPGSKYHRIKLSQIKDRIKNLWTALLNENFVFSFRNTQEISAYRELEEEYGKWTWSLRSAMVKIQDKFHTRINNKQLHQVEYRILVEEMKDTNEKVNESVKCFFESERQEKDMLDQWSGRFKKKIEDLHEDLLKQAKRELDDTISQREARKKLDEQKTQYEAKLFEMSKELALELKCKAKDETELKRHFDSVWRKWVSDLTAEQQPMKEIDIEGDAVEIISEMHEKDLVLNRFKKCDKTTHERESLDYSNNKKYNKIATVHDYTKYVVKKWKVLGTTLTPQDQNSISQLTFRIIHKAEELIKSVPVARLGYQKSYIQEIVKLVKDLVAEHKLKSRKYELQKKFTVDLSLHVCELAREVFATRHKKFREASDPLIYLEKKKPEYYNVFQKFCQGATSVAVFGGLICSDLRESILKCVYSAASSYLTEKMKTDIPAFNGNKINLEKHILKSLAEEENFEKFLTYIQKPQKYFERFIKDTVEKFMKEENPKAMDKIRNIITHKEQLVIAAAETATKEVTNIKGDANMWLKIFSDCLKDELEYNNEHLSAKNCQDIDDFQLLTDVVKREIPIITEDLNRNFNSLSDLKMETIRKRPDETLIDHFCRCCWVQCPFCKAICTNSVKDHDGDHSVPFHRNYGINGWHHKGTSDLCISFCTTSVASTCSFYPCYDSDEQVLFKEYRTAGPDYANWSITPDLSELPFWKWFVCRCQKDLEKHYKKEYQGRGQIPDGWRKYEKADAIKSLDKYF